jgi:small subunit ribosomal protein S16
MVKIRMRRLGDTKRPFYRVVVADSRSPRDGRFIEAIGRYQPMDEPSLVEIDADRALHWLSVGAQPTQQVQHLLKVAGVWAQFEAASPKTAAKLVEADAKPGKRTSDRWDAAAKDAEAAKRAAAAAAAPPPPPPPPAEEAPAVEEGPAEAAPDEAPAAESEVAPAAEEAAPAEAEAASEDAPAEAEAASEDAPAEAEAASEDAPAEGGEE